MRKEPIVTLDEDKINRDLEVEKRQELVEKCPRRVFKFNEMRNIVEVENADNCILCIECVRYLQQNNYERAITIDENDNKFIFTVESTGVLAPEVIVTKAIKIL